MISYNHYLLLDNLIELIFISASEVANGGTSSTAGVIWANPSIQFTVDDAIELLIHELTHNILFLDEWVHPHYRHDLIVDRKNWCLSAILGIKRPIDKIVLSIIVATEILLFREATFGRLNAAFAHPPSADIRESIYLSITDLRAVAGNNELIHPRVWGLIKTAEEKICGLKHIV